MSSAKATVELNVPPDEVWQLIGGFGSLPDWIPGLSQSKLANGGRVRYLRDPNGQTQELARKRPGKFSGDFTQQDEKH